MELERVSVHLYAYTVYGDLDIQCFNEWPMARLCDLVTPLVQILILGGSKRAPTHLIVSTQCE